MLVFQEQKAQKAHCAHFHLLLANIPAIVVLQHVTSVTTDLWFGFSSQNGHVIVTAP
jgi:hypothetical protein